MEYTNKFETKQAITELSFAGNEYAIKYIPTDIVTEDFISLYSGIYPNLISIANQELQNNQKLIEFITSI